MKTAKMWCVAVLPPLTGCGVSFFFLVGSRKGARPVVGHWAFPCAGAAEQAKHKLGQDTVARSAVPPQLLPRKAFPKQLLQALQKSWELSVVIVTDPLLLNWP